MGSGPRLWGKIRPLAASFRYYGYCPRIPSFYPLRPSRMRKPKPFYRVLTESGPLVALTVAIALLVGIAGPASAQFFNFGGWSRPAAPPRPGGGGGGGGGWFGGDFFAPFQQQQQPKRVQDFSR